MNNKLSIRLLCHTYLLFILLIASILSALPYRIFAVILLLVTLFATFRTLPPRINVVIIGVAIFLVPLVLEPLLRYLTGNTLLPPSGLPLTVIIGSLPIIYLLDYNLRQNAQAMPLAHDTANKRRPTIVLRALFGSALSIFVLSFILNNPLLLFAAIPPILYLLVTLIRVLHAVPELSLSVPAVQKRIIAGTTANISLYAASRASIRLHSVLSPADPWVKVTPQRLTLNKDKITLNLSITPPLAGPSRPQLQASVIDPWGFIQASQIIEAIELQVIPRARYAEWLAMKYLEKEGAVDVAFGSLPKAILIPMRGVEYFDSRTYQPGDPLRNIDWKHTLKLNQLIVKQYIQTGAGAAIVMVNLSVGNRDEADRLAFNLITTALTLAQERIPSALAVYDYKEVVLTTPVTDPRETLKRTLSLVKDITSVEFAQRFLEPPNIGKLGRNITLLRQARSQPAKQLLSILDFEYRAIREAAKNHPATLALSAAIKQTRPPATITILSQLNHDAEALLMIAEQVSRRGFTTLHIESPKH
ncbi:MAG: DUF58 domain-containing protein [Chloroflexota bacterium]